MKSTVGFALALTLALVGCQGNQGGGGGTAEKRPMMGQQDKTAKLEQQAHNDLRDATRNAGEARTDVTQKDWDSAKSNLDEVQDKLSDLSKNAPAEIQANLGDVKKMADKAEASIKNHSANAKQDLDKLVMGLNKMTTSGVKAGGGKSTTEK